MRWTSWLKSLRSSIIELRLHLLNYLYPKPDIIGTILLPALISSPSACPFCKLFCEALLSTSSSASNLAFLVFKISLFSGKLVFLPPVAQEISRAKTDM